MALWPKFQGVMMEVLANVKGQKPFSSVKWNPCKFFTSEKKWSLVPVVCWQMLWANLLLLNWILKELILDYYWVDLCNNQQFVTLHQSHRIFQGRMAEWGCMVLSEQGILKDYALLHELIIKLIYLSVFFVIVLCSIIYCSEILIITWKKFIALFEDYMFRRYFFCNEQVRRVLS